MGSKNKKNRKKLGNLTVFCIVKNKIECVRCTENR